MLPEWQVTGRSDLAPRGPERAQPFRRRCTPNGRNSIRARWYAAYPLGFRRVEEMMAVVDHATVHRWAVKILPLLTAVFRRRKRPVGSSWRMDETHVRVAGQ